MDTTLALSSIGAIIGALVLFIILKRVVGLFFRIILAGVLFVAVIVGAWWWSSKSGDSTGNDNARPRRTQGTQTR
jgi:high-affinity Fe2+/Pb2+ permease